jgi:hypothetical protein
MSITILLSLISIYNLLSAFSKKKYFSCRHYFWLKRSHVYKNEEEYVKVIGASRAG